LSVSDDPDAEGRGARRSRRAWLRQFGSVFVAFGCAAVAAGCSTPRLVAPSRASLSSVAGGSVVAAAAVQPTAKPVTTLSFWTEWSGATRQVWSALMADFHRGFPSIQIESNYYSLSDLSRNTLLAAASGTLPDLWLNAAIVSPDLITDGVVAALDSLGPVPVDFYPAANSATMQFGKRWAVPNNGGVAVLWYNTDLFRSAGLDPARPPETWDDLVRYGKEMTRSGQGTWGLVVPNRHYPWTAECWYGFLLQAGGDLYSPDQQKITFNSPAGVAALTLWADLYQTVKTAPLEVFDADSLRSTYGTGTIGMFPTYSVEMAHIQSFPVQSRNAPFPKMLRRGTHFAGNYTTISAKSLHKFEAYTWCSWWWQPEVNAIWCARTGGLPARVSATAHPIYQEFIASQPLVRASLDSLPFARALPRVPGISDVLQRLSEAICDACFGYKSPKEALDSAMPAMNTKIASDRFVRQSEYA